MREKVGSSLHRDFPTGLKQSDGLVGIWQKGWLKGRRSGEGLRRNFPSYGRPSAQITRSALDLPLFPGRQNRPPQPFAKAPEVTASISRNRPHRSVVVLSSLPLILASLPALRLRPEHALSRFMRPDLFLRIPGLKQPRRLPHAGVGIPQARTSLQHSFPMRGVIVSELIGEREAERRDHAISILVRNGFVTARDQPALGDVSSVMKT